MLENLCQDITIVITQNELNTKSTFITKNNKNKIEEFSYFLNV